uniref:Uncharacterized protein n=1 Tax=Anguilla anguilla TaxID=7936 RepID=A0A0E9PAY6_ANGAN
MVNGRPLVQQQGFELHLLHTAESVKYHSQKQVHDEIELNGQVNNEKHTGPAIPGVCRHHYIRKVCCCQKHKQADNTVLQSVEIRVCCICGEQAKPQEGEDDHEE